MTNSPIWGHAPTEPIITKFGVRGLVGDLITGDKFCRDRLRGFRSVGIRKWGSPIDLSCRPYNRSALPCCLWCTVYSKRDRHEKYMRLNVPADRNIFLEFSTRSTSIYKNLDPTGTHNDTEHLTTCKYTNVFFPTNKSIITWTTSYSAINSTQHEQNVQYNIMGVATGAWDA